MSRLAAIAFSVSFTGLSNCFLGSVRLGDQVCKPRPDFAWCVAGCTSNDLYDFGQARTIANCKRVVTPYPVESFFRHTESDDDVNVVSVVLLSGVFERDGDTVTFGGIVVHQVGYSQNPSLGSFDELESRCRVNSLPLAQRTNDVIDLPNFVLRAFARIDIGNVDDRLFRWIEDVQDVINV